MESYSIIVIIFGVLSLLLLIGLFFVNRLISYRNKVERQFVAVSDCLEMRIELIEQVINFIENNLSGEKSYLLKLNDVKEYVQKFLGGDRSFRKFRHNEKLLLEFNDFDKMYSFLKKNSQFLELRDNILVNCEKLVYALDSYDKGVKSYSNYKSNKFIYFISKLFRFPDYDCYSEEV